MFSHGSSSSISLAIVTPSFVIVGAPHFLSRTTLRPRGPSVTRTASASLLTPRSRPSRASESNFTIFDITAPLGYVGAGDHPAPECCVCWGGLAEDREDVAGRQDQQLLATDFD